MNIIACSFKNCSELRSIQILNTSLHDYLLFYLVLKCVLFETTKKGLINSPEIYGYSFMERPSIYVCFLAPPP